MFAKNGSQHSGRQFRASVDLSRPGRLIIVAVGGMNGRLVRGAITQSNQELVDHLSAGGKQTLEQSTFQLFDRHTLPNSFFNQGRESITANFTNTSDLLNSFPVVIIIDLLHGLRLTVCYTRIASHEGHFPTLPVLSGLTPQVRSHSS